MDRSVALGVGGALQRAIDQVATIPGAGEAFALIAEPKPEVAEIVDEGAGPAVS